MELTITRLPTGEYKCDQCKEIILSNHDLTLLAYTNIIDDQFRAAVMDKLKTHLSFDNCPALRKV